MEGAPAPAAIFICSRVQPFLLVLHLHVQVRVENISQGEISMQYMLVAQLTALLVIMVAQLVDENLTWRGSRLGWR